MVIFSKPVPGLSQATLVRFLSRARKATKLDGRVNVLVTDDAQMRQLNRRFRKKDKPTDVLSFPAASAGMADSSVRLAGELAISLNIAKANAAQLGHPLAAEIKILVLHGLLHLAGYDHETDDGKMARKELCLRKELGLPESLIERSKRVTPQPKPANASRRSKRV